MDDATRAFKGIWIPAEIWLNKNLTLVEKVFLVEIDSLDNSEGCFAGNDYFSNFFGLSKNRCSEIIKSLEKKELVSISYVYKPNTKLIEKRVIKVLDKSNIGIRNLDRGIRNLDRGCSENCEDNNTVFNNTVNNISTTQSSAVVDTNIELIESKTHLKLSKNMKKIAHSWEKERLSKAIDLFNSKNGKYFSLLEKIYSDDGNFSKNTSNSIGINNKNYTPTNKFANFDQSFFNYTEDELNEIIKKSQKEKFDN